MKLFDMFKKTAPEAPEEKEKKGNSTLELEIFSGMRVSVENAENQILFLGELRNLQKDTVEVHQFSEPVNFQAEEPFPVKLRGYNDHARKAVFMEGTLTPREKHIWLMEDLKVVKIENERAFFRLSTDIEATATTYSGLDIGEKACRVLNISVGGVCISSDYQYHKGDRFLLKLKLLEELPPSVIYCEVLRIIEKDRNKDGYEYGCRFLELTEADQEQIVKNIFVAQRKK